MTLKNMADKCARFRNSKIPISDYERGLNDAWELARKISQIDVDKIRNVIPEDNTMYPLKAVFQKLTVQEAFARMKTYEEEQLIHVNDEVQTFNGTHKGVVTFVRTCGDFFVLWDNGTADIYTTKVVKKTGRIINIQSILAQIGAEENG